METVDSLLYGEISRNPLARTIRLDERELRVGRRQIPVTELNLLAMADAYLRGQWLGGGGAERPLQDFGTARGPVPVTRVSGSSKSLKPHRAAEFAHTLGDLAVRHSGGPEAVRRHAEYAQELDVPLWIARRTAPAPHGPVTVTVDRLTARVDVWSQQAPLLQLRAPAGLPLDRKDPVQSLRATLDRWPVELFLDTHGSRRLDKVVLRMAGQEWVLRQQEAYSSQLLREGHQVAVIVKPRKFPAGQVLLPLAEVSYDTSEPLDAIAAHTLAVSFGIGYTNGVLRLGGDDYQRASHPRRWRRPWFTGVGTCPGDTGQSANRDGWHGGTGGGSGLDGGGDGDGDGGGDGGE